MKRSKGDKAWTAKVDKKFNAQGHDLDIVSAFENKGDGYIYERCRNCGISVYIWATNGQNPCSKAVNQ